MELKTVAIYHCDFPGKFGIPRQSGLVKSLEGKVVFEKEYASPEACRGLEGFSHIWLLWGFSEAKRSGNSLTVRPPRLGGNKRVGVFATRSPFRPNPIGLSCVELVGIREGKEGVVLEVRGGDLMDGTPVYDVKPYLPFADSVPEAREGFAGEVKEDALAVAIPENLLERVPEEKRGALREVLRGDPRPGYHSDGERVYGFPFAGKEIRFVVKDGLLTVTDIL